MLNIKKTVIISLGIAAMLSTCSAPVSANRNRHASHSMVERMIKRYDKAQYHISYAKLRHLSPSATVKLVSRYTKADEHEYDVLSRTHVGEQVANCLKFHAKYHCAIEFILHHCDTAQAIAIEKGSAHKLDLDEGEQAFIDARTSKYGVGSDQDDVPVSTTKGLKKASEQENGFATQVRSYIIKYTNEVRRAHGLRPFKITTPLQECADYRAPKVEYAYGHQSEGAAVAEKTEHLTADQIEADGGSTDGWCHGDDTHTSGYDWLSAHNYDDEYWGANNGDWNTGVDYLDGYAPTDYGDTPQSVAWHIVNGYMNQDDSDNNHNGHRDTILDSSYHYMGVGVTFNQQTGEGTDNEQFA